MSCLTWILFHSAQLPLLLNYINATMDEDFVASIDGLKYTHPDIINFSLG